MTRRVFHIVPADEWLAVRGDYAPASLRAEGFVHCSDAGQVLDTAARFFAGRTDLRLLEIDVDRLTSRLVYENTEGGAELYPHVYGGIPRAALVSAEPLRLAADGVFVAPPSLKHALESCNPSS